ncbi:MAG: hypothetical protein N4A64_11135 [Marinisporobacter sp.]|jgi:hypothetical protein|nr:hypothetical protein [Marinisporobacter sp.]
MNELKQKYKDRFQELDKTYNAKMNELTEREKIINIKYQELMKKLEQKHNNKFKEMEEMECHLNDILEKKKIEISIIEEKYSKYQSKIEKFKEEVFYYQDKITSQKKEYNKLVLINEEIVQEVENRKRLEEKTKRNKLMSTENVNYMERKNKEMKIKNLKKRINEFAHLPHIRDKYKKELEDLLEN